MSEVTLVHILRQNRNGFSKFICPQRFVSDFCGFLSFMQLKSGRIAFKVWMYCFQSLDAWVLKSGRGVSIGRKRGFWWMEDGTGIGAALYWYGWQGRLQDYRITPCFLNPGFLKLHIYTIYLFNYILLFIYIHIFIYILIYIHKSSCEKLLVLFYF